MFSRRDADCETRIGARRMKIEVQHDDEAVARNGAAIIAADARAAVPARGRFIMAMSGGRTPWVMLRTLADEQLPWEHVHVVQVDERVAPLVDVMIGNEEDFSASLGFAVPGIDEHILQIEAESFKKMIDSVLKEFPFKVVATTLRKAKSASTNDWSAICYAGGKPQSAIGERK